MAIRAQKIAVVIKRFVSQAGVTEIGRYPRGRAMTQAAILRRIKVSRILAGCRRAVMARRTGAKHLVMIHRGYWHPGITSVAVFADVGCLDMGRAFTRSVGAVVAAKAVIDDVDVVEIGRQPGDRRVAVVTVVAAIDMARVLPSGCDAIMAGSTSAYDLGVIDRKHGCPDIRRMAVLTDVGGLHMGRSFAGRIRAVMAAHAIASDIDVIEVCRQPARSRVTVVAVVATGDVRRVLAGGRDTVVTGTAGAQYLCVIDRKDGRPDVRRMAIFTDIACLQVRRTFSGRFDTVMAADAVARNVDVVEVGGQPAGCRVTVIAVGAAGDMRRVFAGGRDAVMAGTAAT